MPLYEFRNVERPCEVLELHFAMADAPPIGSIIDRNGAKWRRMASGAQVDAGLEAKSNFPYVSTSLPLNLAGCPHAADGSTIVLSRQHEREIAAKHGLKIDRSFA